MKDGAGHHHEQVSVVDYKCIKQVQYVFISLDDISLFCFIHTGSSKMASAHVQGSICLGSLSQSAHSSCPLNMLRSVAAFQLIHRS